MQRYPPPDDDPPTSWREIFAMMGVIFQILAGPMVIIVGALLLLVGLFFAATTNVLLTIPIFAVLGAGIAHLARKAREDEAEAMKEIEAGRFPRGSRRPPPGR